MDLVKGIASLLVILSILVVVHEWGHFIVARLFGMRVEEFSLFFGKVLVRLGVRGGTVFNLRSVPLGGFVRIAGMEADDISGGRPILEAIRGASTADASSLEGALKDLGIDSFSEIDMSKISEPVRQAVHAAVGPDQKLSEEGLLDLQGLLRSPVIQADEHRLIDLVLQAHVRATDPALYSSRPIYQRALVIFAGPFVSLLFGYLVFCVMGMTVGLPNDKLTNRIIVLTDKNSPARVAGLRSGDRIVALDGKTTTRSEEIREIIRHSIAKPVAVKVDRGGQKLDFSVTPRAEKLQTKGKDGKVETETIGRIDIIFDSEYSRCDPVESVVAGTRYTYTYLATLASTFTRGKARDMLGGPIAMTQMATVSQRMGIAHQAELMAMFSLSLGVMNLLPIPILDGGHLLLLSIEKVRRRKLSAREVYRAQMVGLGVLALIVGFVMYNDIVRTITGNAMQ